MATEFSSKTSRKGTSRPKRVIFILKLRLLGLKWLFEIENGHLEIENGHFEIENGHFEIDNGHFEIKNGHFEVENDIF